MAPRLGVRQRIAPQDHVVVEASSSSESSSTQPSRAVAAAAAHDNKNTKKPIIPPQTEADYARDRHDYFNIIALVIVIAVMAMNYDLEKLQRLEGLQWTGNHFLLCFWTCQAYFLIDLLWVAMVPICVKSPGLIIKHHCMAMVYLLAPLYSPEYRWFLGAVLSVEINTWFLIARRVVYKYGEQRGKELSPLITESISALFYISWIVIRCGVYPAVLVNFLQLGYDVYYNEGGFVLAMLFIPLHAALCALNLKWTYDLFKPIVTRWLGIGPKTITVANGL